MERKTPDVPQELQRLHEFEGHWDVSQKVWEGPNAKPLASSGKCDCRVILDGLGVTLAYDFEKGNRMKGFALITHNAPSNQLELAWADTFTTGGVTMMTGREDRGPSRGELGRKHAGATQERVWSAAPVVERFASGQYAAGCVPPDAAGPLIAGLGGGPGALERQSFPL